MPRQTRAELLAQIEALNSIVPSSFTARGHAYPLWQDFVDSFVLIDPTRPLVTTGTTMPDDDDKMEGIAQLHVKTTSPYRLWFHSGDAADDWIPMSDEVRDMLDPFTARMRFRATRWASSAEWSTGLSPIATNSHAEGDEVYVDFTYPAALDPDAIASNASYRAILYPSYLPDPRTAETSTRDGSFTGGGFSLQSFSIYFEVFDAPVTIGTTQYKMAVDYRRLLASFIQAPYKVRFMWNLADFE